MDLRYTHPADDVILAGSHAIVAGEALPLPVHLDRVELFLANILDIQDVYGRSVARGVVEALVDRLERFIGHRHAQIAGEPNTGRISIVSHEGRSGLDQLLVGAVSAAALAPVSIDGTEIVASLAFGGVVRNSPQRIATRSTAEYRANMAAAVAAHAALLDGQLRFVEQAVSSSGCDAAQLYRERLARIGTVAGQTIMPAAFLPALERLELTRAFDALVVGLTIEELRRRPDAVLGCNISALSVAFDGWWYLILSELGADRSLAQRLVIEITETAQVPDEVSAGRLLEALRACGCRIALDDFGEGHSSIARARWMRPDIIKIDRSFIASSQDGSAPYAFLRRLVGLADILAPVVVVEGVDCQSGLESARLAAARWVQGFFVGEPMRPADGQRKSLPDDAGRKPS